jgi:DNA-binding response OmpR family regulator
LRLLVVEDEARIAEILRAALARAGFVVTPSLSVRMREQLW